MTDNATRHIISFLGTICFLLVFVAGYIAGSLGWWILFVVVLVLYPIIFKLVSTSSGHH